MSLGIPNHSGKRFLAFTKETNVGEVLRSPRITTRDHRNIFYVYVVAGEEQTLLGDVDLRDLVTVPEDAALGDLMISPVVTAPADALREDLIALFARYQFPDAAGRQRPGSFVGPLIGGRGGRIRASIRLAFRSVHRA